MQMSTACLNDLTQDQLLVQWQEIKNKIDHYKSAEMELRKYIVSRAFPDKHEGTNTQELGNGYQLKAAVKYNYTLDNDNKKVQSALDKISQIGNAGGVIADRLVNWKPSLSLSEYRELQDDDSPNGKLILKVINEVLVIKEATPTLEIKEPKAKR